MSDPEREIGALLDRGDLAGAATLVLRAYGPELRRFLERTLRSREDAADAMSQLGEDLWRALPGFRRECKARTWCYQLAWRGALRLRRRRSRKLVRPLRTSEWSRLAATVPAPSAAAPSSRRARLEELHAELAPGDRALLHLRVDEELPWEEITGVLSTGGERLNAAALRKRYERLRERLTELARARGLLAPA